MLRVPRALFYFIQKQISRRQLLVLILIKSISLIYNLSSEQSRKRALDDEIELTEAIDATKPTSMSQRKYRSMFELLS